MSEYKENPSMFAIIPARVRYDKNLSPNAKLLFVEISALLQHNNRCYASNSYFARVFSLSDVQVSRLLKQLIDAKYVEVDYKKTQKGTQRFVRLTFNIFDNSALNENVKPALNINVKHNSNSINSNSSSTIVEGAPKKRKVSEFIKPTVEQVKEYFKEKGYTEESAIKAFDYYDIASWKDAKGSSVKNWKQKMISVWFKPENKEQEKQSNKIIF